MFPRFLLTFFPPLPHPHFPNNFAGTKMFLILGKKVRLNCFYGLSRPILSKTIF